jgi:hypothetical protein
LQNEKPVFYWKTSVPDNDYMTSNLPVMAYVEMQKWQMLYEGELGLSRGTIFEQLDKPFLGGNTCE